VKQVTRLQSQQAVGTSEEKHKVRLCEVEQKKKLRSKSCGACLEETQKRKASPAKSHWWFKNAMSQANGGAVGQQEESSPAALPRREKNLKTLQDCATKGVKRKVGPRSGGKRRDLPAAKNNVSGRRVLFARIARSHRERTWRKGVGITPGRAGESGNLETAHLKCWPAAEHRQKKILCNADLKVNQRGGDWRELKKGQTRELNDLKGGNEETKRRVNYKRKKITWS